MKNIVLIGVQGSGKGTLAKKIKEELGYAHISVGDILRQRAKVGDALGIDIKNLIDNGNMVSNDIAFRIIKEEITKEECKNGYILDGFPRSIEQAKGYEKILQETKKDIGVVINLDAPIDVIKKRILGRRVCKKCGSIYNIDTPSLMPKQEGICDLCGNTLQQREDDNNGEALEKRIDTYHLVTEPLIDYYKSLGVLETIFIDDNSTVEGNFEKVKKLI